MRLHGIVILAVAMLVGADAPKKDAAKGDKEKLHDTWKPVSVEMEGMDVTDKLVKIDDGTELITFAGDKMVSKQGPEQKEKAVPFKIDPSKKPKHFDLDLGDGKVPMRAIYQLDGDELRICFSLSEKQERPAEFATKEASQTMTWVYKRHKQ